MNQHHNSQHIYFLHRRVPFKQCENQQAGLLCRLDVADTFVHSNDFNIFCLKKCSSPFKLVTLELTTLSVFDR